MRNVQILGLVVMMLFMSSPVVWAQSEPQMRVDGVVVREGTGEPVAYAELWIDGTQLETRADDEGRFSIERLPARDHKVAVSLPGVGAVTVEMPLDAVDALPLVLSVSFEEDEASNEDLEGLDAEALKKEVIRLRAEVRVLQEELAHQTDKRTKDARLVKLFNKVFVGDPSHCKLLNPEVLSFQDEKRGKVRVVRVWAEKPLHIENRRLGYHVRMVLEEAVIYKYDWKYEVRYQAVVHFRELAPRNEKERKLWVRSRRTAYRGSMRHFLTALASRRLQEEGFVLKKRRENTFASTSSPGLPGITNLGPVESLYITIVEPYAIVSTTDDPNEMALQFDGPVQVAYSGIDVDYDYLMYAGVSEGYPSTSISLMLPSVRFSRDGFLDNPKELVTRGFWSVRRVVDLLPHEYALE